MAKSKDTVLTPKIRHVNMSKKGGVNNMTNEVCRFTLRISKELKEQLEKRSREVGISLNSMVVIILNNWVRRDEQGK